MFCCEVTVCWDVFVYDPTMSDEESSHKPNRKPAPAAGPAPVKDTLPKPATDRRKAPLDRRKVTRGGRRATDFRESKSSVPRGGENDPKGKS